MRNILNPQQVNEKALQKISSYHRDIVAVIETAIQQNDWVIVGMGQNPVVKNAKKFLNEKNIPFKSIDHGTYFSMWKERLAIKLWSGWPTFPQVFHKGKLIGGFEELKNYSAK